MWRMPLREVNEERREPRTAPYEISTLGISMPSGGRWARKESGEWPHSEKKKPRVSRPGRLAQTTHLLFLMMLQLLFCLGDKVGCPWVLTSYFISFHTLPDLTSLLIHFFYVSLFVLFLLIYRYCWKCYRCPLFPPLAPPPRTRSPPQAPTTPLSVSMAYAYSHILSHFW